MNRNTVRLKDDWKPVSAENKVSVEDAEWRNLVSTLFNKMYILKGGDLDISKDGVRFRISATGGYTGPFTSTLNMDTEHAEFGYTNITTGKVYLRSDTGVGYTVTPVSAGSVAGPVAVLVTDFSAGTTAFDSAADVAAGLALATATKAVRIISVRSGTTPAFTIEQYWKGGDVWYDRD